MKLLIKSYKVNIEVSIATNVEAPRILGMAL